MDRKKLFDGLELLGRLLLGALFISDTWTIFNNYDASQDYLAQFGVPPQLLLPAAALHLGGGILVAVGWQTRLAALALALFCFATAIIFHYRTEDLAAQVHFWKDLAIAGGFLVLLAHGAGTLSLDARLRRATTV